MINRKGFTLVEILIVVLILIILVTMAVPMFDRALEKSHLAEVETNLKRLGEAKQRLMDERNVANFTNGAFTINQLDIGFVNSQEFTYSLYPSTFPNAVCAVRSRGDAKDTTFLFLGEEAEETCASTSGNICSKYKSNGQRFFCQDSSNSSNSCELYYGLTSYNIGTCGADE